MICFCKPSVEPCNRTPKTAVAAVGLTLSFLTMAIVLAGDTAVAAGDEPEMCRRAKALGYDENTDVFLKYIQTPIDRQEHCTKRFWQHFQPKPLAKILSSDELRTYHERITSGDCIGATEILSERFAAAHPTAPNHRDNFSSRSSWRSGMSTHFYDSIGLCNRLGHLRRVLGKIDAAGIVPRPFWNWRANYFAPPATYPPPVREMYLTVGSLLREMGSTQSPKVALAVLRVSNEGRALKLHPHYEVYIALRLRELGMTDPLITKIINRPLDVKTRRYIEERVEKKDPSDLPKFADKHD